MTDDPGSLSFDPRTWAKSGAKPGAGPEDKNTAPQKPSPTPPRRPAPPQTPLLDRRNLIALGAGAAILIAGLITATLSHRTHNNGGVVVSAASPTPALPVDDGTTTRSLTLPDPSRLVEALAATGVSADDAQKAAAAAQGQLGGGSLRLVAHLKAGSLVAAEITRGDSSGVRLIRNGDTYTVTPLAAALKTVTIVRRGEIDTNSFYTSAVTAGITDSLIPDFAKAFAYDFDFQREINPGDVFEAAFEETQNADGQVVGQPHLIYASLSTAAKSEALYFYTPPDGDAGWFDGNGASIIKSFLRTPIDGAHITSQFGMRVHPVLGFMKMHKGTDFGAPIGTPIYAAGDGVIAWAAMKGPNGNLTIIQHDNGWQTYYLHQSAFAPGIAAGVRVHQGETIGYVGTTGRSTGPHLHYEMHIDGQPVDAMKVPLEAGHSLSAADLPAFFKERDRIDAIRAQAVD